jgi:hypothetical protein
MTETQFRARIDAMIEAEYESFGGDAFRARFGDAMADEVLTKCLARRIQAEAEHDDEFRRAYCYDQARRDVGAYLEATRPQGAYRQDGMLRLAGSKLIEMPMASREQLLAWALVEDDERNLAYIRSRLDQWDAHPECKTLAELESLQPLAFRRSE